MYILLFQTAINADQEHTRIILSVLDNIDERVIAHIDSITVLSSITVSPNQNEHIDSSLS